MKTDPKKKREKAAKPAPIEGENLTSTRLLFGRAPKVPGAETAVFFNKVFKKNKPGKA